MAFPVKGWPKRVGRGLRNRGGHLLFLFNRAWKPLNIETQNARRRRSRWYRGGLLETSRDPPLTRAAMTRRQIAWIVNYPEQRSFPCYDMCNIDSDDEDIEDTRVPFMTRETECILSSSYQDFGVSVTISGHRFIALTKETSWIDNCKACGKVDAVEFITRCGSQKLCSRQCVQMLVRHRRYKRQIQERPLFLRSASNIQEEYARPLEEEIILEKAPKRKYTKRKPPATSKATSKQSKSNDPDGKPAKRSYVKRSHKPEAKLKVKMQLNSPSSSKQKNAHKSHCFKDCNEKLSKSTGLVENVEKHKYNDIAEPEHTVGTSEHPEDKQFEAEEDMIQDGNPDLPRDDVNQIKLGHVKIVLKKI